MIAYLALVAIGFALAAAIGARAETTEEDRARAEAIRRLDYPRF